jgi:TolB-like protein/Tfp pilus assembly protein PilF
MIPPDNSVLRIGALRVDPALDEICTGGTTIKLEPRTMRLLVCLARHAGQVVSVEQLLDEVWHDVVVNPDSVYQAIAMLRRVLGDDAKAPTYIANVLRRGYRLVAPVAPWVGAPTVPETGSSAIKSTVTTGPIGDKSIAVLPFIDLSEEKDQEYFADGMAAEILYLLANLPGLTVIGRTSSFQFKGKSEDLRTIGTKLGAAYVVEGSVRRSRDRVRIGAQLIDTKTGAHRWSDTYDYPLGEVLKIQDSIAAEIGRALQVTLDVDALQSRPGLRNAEAYDLYLRGRHALDRFDKSGIEEAAGFLQQSLDLEPTFSLAASWLADTYFVAVLNEWVPPSVGFKRIREATRAALKLSPSDAFMLGLQGQVSLIYDWDWAAAETATNRALRLAPRQPFVQYCAARVSSALGRWNEAVHRINTALSIDPLWAPAHLTLGRIRYRSGALPEAEAAFRRMLQISPTYAWGHWYMGLVLLARGESTASLAEFQQEASSVSARYAGLALVYHAMGRKTDSDAALSRLTEDGASDLAFYIAEVYAFRGESDEAIAWLNRAYKQKDPELYLIKGDPLLKGLERDSRYKAFMRNMKLPE